MYSSMEDESNGRQPQQKMTSMEDDLYEDDLYEDDLNGR